MTNFSNYWEHIPSAHRTLILVCGLLFFWILEGAIPLFHLSYKKWRHAGPNLFFTFTTVLVNLPFAYFIIKTCQWTSDHHFGLLYLVPFSPWIQALVGFMLLDFIGAYLIHLTEHQVKWMWKFHVIHHIDRNVDVTTANRHHPMESVFRASFTLLAVWVSGSPIWLLMMYQSLSVLFSQFNHANIHLPRTVDRLLSWVIVSPDMHKVHHHYKQPMTDSNYGNIFSFWDRIFSTFTRHDADKLTYGLDTHMPEGERDKIGNLLEIPFQAYRPRE